MCLLHGHRALAMHCIIYQSYQTPLIHQFITKLLSAWEFTWVHFAAQLQPDASLKIKTNFLSLPHHQFCFFWDCNKIRIFAIINIAQWYRSITCNISYKEQRYTRWPWKIIETREEWTKKFVSKDGDRDVCKVSNKQIWKFSLIVFCNIETRLFLSKRPLTKWQYLLTSLHRV